MAITAAPFDSSAPSGAITAGRRTAFVTLVAIIATVFNDLPPYLPLGELSKDGFVYVFPLLMAALLRRPEELEAPRLLLFVLTALLVICVMGVATNFEQISSAWFKGRTGKSRIFTQLLSIGFGFGVALAFYNLIRRGLLDTVTRGAYYALATMFFVGVIESLTWFSVPGVTQFYEAISLFIHAQTSEYYPLRLRSTAFEVSWAGVMLSFAFPFALAHAGKSRWKMLFCLGAIGFLAPLAQSRTAMLVLGCQCLLLVGFRLVRRLDVVVRLGLAGVLLGLVLMSVQSVQEPLAEKLTNLIEYGSIGGSVDESNRFENVSNITRFAAIRAGIEMFKDRPVFGVGLGQYGFNYPRHIRAEDMRSWEVRSYVTDADRELAWPPTYSIHVRLLAETGLLGYAVWLGMVLIVAVRSILNVRNSTLVGRAHLAVVMTMLGWLLLGFSIDSFRFFGGWIALGVGMALPSTIRLPIRFI